MKKRILRMCSRRAVFSAQHPALLLEDKGMPRGRGGSLMLASQPYPPSYSPESHPATLS